MNLFSDLAPDIGMARNNALIESSFVNSFAGKAYFYLFVDVGSSFEPSLQNHVQDERQAESSKRW